MDDGQRLEAIEGHPSFESALEIVKKLAHEGYQTVLAGGCVRDALLGIRAKDLDLATAAKPEEIEAAFTKTLAVGKAFGTIVVVVHGQNFEVTTFRIDGPYLDGRHPTSVTFSRIEEDARRRDFTVNALFYDPLKRKVIDFVGGKRDLKLGLIRAVGDPSERFREDRLRMLRAIRFVGQLGFDLEPGVMEAIRSDYEELSRVSSERIFNEIKRLLESDYLLKGLQALLGSKLENVFWPELSGFNIDLLLPFPRFLNWENAFAAICALSKINDPEPRMRAWKVSKDSMRRIRGQLDALELFTNPRSTRADRARLFGGEYYAESLNLFQGIFDEAKIKKWISEYLEVADEEGRLPKPFLGGEDLAAFGIVSGPKMGELLKQVYDAQLEGRVRSRPEALSELKRIKST